MRLSICLLPLVPLSLAACSTEPDEPKTTEEIVEEAQKLEKPLPGQYTSTTEILEFEVPGLPPAQADQMKRMFANIGNQETSFCMTQEQADEGFRDAVQRMGEGQDGMACTFDAFEVSGNDLDATMTCEGGQAGTATMKMDGTLEAERQQIEMAVAQENSMIPGGQMNIRMRVTSERTGDCSA